MMKMMKNHNLCHILLFDLLRNMSRDNISAKGNQYNQSIWKIGVFILFITSVQTNCPTGTTGYNCVACPDGCD